jgi:glycogen synthase
MKILVVSNYYPPFFVGGYELGCRDVVNRLTERGHDVRILTSTYGKERSTSVPDSHVDRVLGLNSAPADSPQASKVNIFRDCQMLVRDVFRFKPDVVYFWNQASLSHWLVECARLLGRRIAFFLSDTCFTSWRTGAFLHRFAGSAAHARFSLIQAMFGNTWLIKGHPVIQNQTCHFASDFLQQHAVNHGIHLDSEHSLVAHWGIDPTIFNRQFSASAHPWPPQKLLYVGQLIPQKGVHTAIEALSLFCKQPAFENASLSIVGGGTNLDYENELRSLAAQLGVSSKVHFMGRIDRTQLPTIYQNHDILVFPSIWDEPFAITPLEAMYSMLPVVGTLTGGSGELFVNRETAMTFEAGNADSCVQALLELSTHPALYDSIRERGAQIVASSHTLDRMVDQIEEALLMQCRR